VIIGGNVPSIAASRIEGQDARVGQGVKNGLAGQAISVKPAPGFCGRQV
jgi:hypothetical protein